VRSAHHGAWNAPHKIRQYFLQENDMSKEVFLPAWLSMLSLAVALFFPLGGALISDTSRDAGRNAGDIAHNGAEASVEQSHRQKL
jgi:hypothetical protein